MIVLLGIKFYTSFFLMTKDKKPDWALALHVNSLTDILLIITVVFHACYGLRTILYDLGVKKEKLLFWFFTVFATIVSAFLIVLYFTRNY
jgi:succinate dehydrogenase/fumarate reductase cytochrome b subunit